SRSSSTFCFCFFFQEEGGIRDRNVTGVQTCALPISPGWRRSRHRWIQFLKRSWFSFSCLFSLNKLVSGPRASFCPGPPRSPGGQIGRASRRESVAVAVSAVASLFDGEV